ncbi:MAG TPA: peptide-methionine (S)-S-oxide reductase MsrA [Candidatus Eisenbacteria bacterium]|nr:peptide-methionine (S)-S-oxide reductase MsrA [Candidatus Eisenbacteria bacterium]
MWLFGRAKTELPTPEQALPGRDEPMPVVERHAVLGSSLAGPYPEGAAIAEFALGCFWGAERGFWEAEGVISTAVGYEGGFTPNPTYEEVCSGRTGHAETVRVVYDPERVSYRDLLKVFWEVHDPTQGMRQGNDVGTQYRSMIFVRSEDERRVAEESRGAYQEALTRSRYGPITTEIQPAGEFYFAEDYHQQYLAKNPWGYCGLGGTGVACPVGVVPADG